MQAKLFDPGVNNRVSRFIRENNGDFLKGIVAWIDQDTTVDWFRRLEFAARILSYAGYFKSDTRYRAWKEAITLLTEQRRYSLFDVPARRLFRDTNVEEVGIVVDNGGEPIVHISEIVTREILIAFCLKQAQLPDVDGVMHFQVFNSNNETEKIIYLVDEDGVEQFTYCRECKWWCSSDAYMFYQTGNAGAHWMVCSDCWQSYHYCEYCQEHVREESWDYDRGCCTSCAERSVECLVDSGVEITFFGHDDAEHYAFELEEGKCPTFSEYVGAVRDVHELGSNDIGEFYAFKSDCSIVGPNKVEVVTQPFTWEWFRENEGIVSDMVTRFDEAGFESGTAANAGLHIHVDASFFSQRTLYITGRFLYYNEAFLFNLSGRTRECFDKWCKTVPTMPEISWLRELDWWQHHPSRYLAMNCQSIAKHNTVEFRFFNGTNSFDLLKARLEIIHAIIHLADAWKDPGVTITPDDLLRYMKKHKYTCSALEEVGCAWDATPR